MLPDEPRRGFLRSLAARRDAALTARQGLAEGVEPMRRRFPLIGLALLLVSTTVANAQNANWLEEVFPQRFHDFGTVAKGSKVSHTFKVINTTDQDIHIASVAPKCGCTDVKVRAYLIPPGTQTVIEALIDTTKFQGKKDSGLTLKLDKPVFAEVDLNLTCFIRTDVVVNPGQVDFGTVSRQSKPTLAINLTYTGGNPNWGITKIQVISPHIKATAQEVARSGGQVQYVISTTLNPTAEIGFFKDEITLLTNDPTGPAIPISVAAMVQSSVTAAPAILTIGRVKAGESVSKTVLVRSGQPFKVTGLKPTRDELSGKVAEGQKTMHSVTLTFKAPAEPGPFNAVMEVQTDLKDEPPLKVAAFATVIQ